MLPRSRLGAAKNFPQLESSRESTHFHGERIPRHGVVVESNLRKHPDGIVMTVVDFACQQTVYVKDVFIPRKKAQTRSQYYKDEKNYDLLENVLFDADENNVVNFRVSRNQKKYIVDHIQSDRPPENTMTVETQCTFRTDAQGTRKCYSEIFGFIDFDEALLDRVLLENVGFDCLVAFTFVPACDFRVHECKKHNIRTRLHKINGVSNELIDLTPGGLYVPGSVRLTTMYEDADIFEPNVRDADKDINHSELTGYRLYDNVVFVLEHPEWKVLLAYDEYHKEYIGHRRDRVAQLVSLTVDVRWSHNANHYVVYSVIPQESRQLLSIGHLTLLSDRLKCNCNTLEHTTNYYSLGQALVFDRYNAYFNMPVGTTSLDFKAVQVERFESTCFEIVYPKEATLEIYENYVFGRQFTAIAFTCDDLYCVDLPSFDLKRKPDVRIFVPGNVYAVVIHAINWDTRRAEFDVVDKHEQRDFMASYDPRAKFNYKLLAPNVIPRTLGKKTYYFWHGIGLLIPEDGFVPPANSVEGSGAVVLRKYSETTQSRLGITNFYDQNKTSMIELKFT